MFEPPRCPNRRCPAHHVETLELPDGGPFFIRKGSYHPKCRARPVPRFQCLKRVMRRTNRFCKKLSLVIFDTDEKTVYPVLARKAFGSKLRHFRFSSKQGRYLDLQLHLFMGYRNFVRPRFNGESETPAQLLRLVRKRMSATELLSWRQDWGWFSIHPLSRDVASIRSVRKWERSQGLASHQRVDALPAAL